MATVVSAYFSIPSKFPPIRYLEWIKDFFENIPCNLVFFTESDLIPLFTTWRGKYMDRTVFMPFNFTRGAEAFKKYGYDFWRSELDKDTEYDFFDRSRKIHSPELYAIWYEKKEFVLKAIALNPFNHEKFLWADAGGFRVTSWYSRLQTFASPKNIPDKKFFLLSINSFTEQETSNYLQHMKDARIGGGYLAAHKDVWPEFSKRYDEMLNEYRQKGFYCGKDQNLMASMIIKHPDFFEVIPTDYTCEDPWFWPQLYFSDVLSPIQPLVLRKEVTVLIPLYNGIEFLPISLSSIKQQTYKSWKIIIGINGHEPNSDIFKMASEIVNTLGLSEKTTILELATKGKPASLNKMVEEVRTAYVAILDVDDIWLPNKLEEQMPFIGSYDVVGAGCQYFGSTDTIPNIPIGDITHFDFFSTNPIINSSVILKTSLLNYNNSETTGLEDYDLWLNLRYKAAAKFYNVPKILVGHRIHSQSAFNNTNSNYLDEFLQRKKKELL
jgi:hypothetical protein